MLRHCRERTAGESPYAGMEKQSLSLEPKAHVVSRLQRNSYVIGKRYDCTDREQVYPEFRW